MTCAPSACALSSPAAPVLQHAAWDAPFLQQVVVGGGVASDATWGAALALAESPMANSSAGVVLVIHSNIVFSSSATEGSHNWSGRNAGQA